MAKQRTSYTFKQRMTLVKTILEGDCSLSYASRMNNIPISTIESWVRKYKSGGKDNLKETTKNKVYSTELKLEAVTYYLENVVSLRSVCLEYNLSSTALLRSWLKLYTSGKAFKSTRKERSYQMKKGRKTTWEERIEIVSYTIDHNFDYHKAEEEYDISYRQAYQWVRKFQEGGPEALEDRRGKSVKPKENPTEEEQSTLKMKELEKRNKYLEVENKLLKKLEEIERRNQKR